MTLIKCKECGSEISSKASKCPKCGLGIESKSNANNKKTIIVSIIIGLLIIVAIIVLILFLNKGKEDEYTTDNYSDKYKSEFYDNALLIIREAEKAYVADSIDDTEKNMYTVTEIYDEYIVSSDKDYVGCITFDSNGSISDVYISNGKYMIVGIDGKNLSKNRKYIKPYTVLGNNAWDYNYEYCIFNESEDNSEENQDNIINNKAVSSKSSLTNSSTTETKTTSNSESTIIDTTSSNSSISVSKKNALKSAKDYLKYSAFSRKGLIHQLEYEKYSTEDATYAVDNAGADWNQEALKSAKDYLKYSAFSYKSLKSQLEYEGFTSSESTYAVDNCGANWNEQAVKSAKQYLDYSAFSRNGLIDQLEYEGFTHEQAVYGVEQNGL